MIFKSVLFPEFRIYVFPLDRVKPTRPIGIFSFMKAIFGTIQYPCPEKPHFFWQCLYIVFLRCKHTLSYSGRRLYKTMKTTFYLSFDCKQAFFRITSLQVIMEKDLIDSFSWLICFCVFFVLIKSPTTVYAILYIVVQCFIVLLSIYVYIKFCLRHELAILLQMQRLKGEQWWLDVLFNGYNSQTLVQIANNYDLM